MSRPPPPRNSSSVSSPKASPAPSSRPPPSSSDNKHPPPPRSSSPSSLSSSPSPVVSSNELPLSLALSLRGIQYKANIDDENNPFLFVSASVLDINSNKFEQGRTEAYPVASLNPDLDFRIMVPFMRLIGKKQILIFDVLIVPYAILAEHIPNIQIMDTRQGLTVPRAILPSVCVIQASWTASMKLFFSNASPGCRGFPPIFERMVLSTENTGKLLLAIPPSIIVTGIPSAGLGGTLRPMVGGSDELGKLKILFRVSKLPNRDRSQYTRTTLPNCFFVIQRPYHDSTNEIQWEPAWVSPPLRSSIDGDLPEVTVPVIALMHPKETESCLPSSNANNVNEVLDKLTVQDIQSRSQMSLKFLFMDWIDNEKSTLDILPLGEIDIPLKDILLFTTAGNTSSIGGKDYPINDDKGSVLHIRSVVYIPHGKSAPKVTPPSASDRKPPPPKTSDTPPSSTRAPPPKGSSPSAGSPKAPPPRKDGSESPRSGTPPPPRKDGPPPSKGAAPPPRSSTRNDNEGTRSATPPPKRDTPPAKSNPPPSKEASPSSSKGAGPPPRKDEPSKDTKTPTVATKSNNPQPTAPEPSTPLAEPTAGTETKENAESTVVANETIAEPAPTETAPMAETTTDTTPSPAPVEASTEIKTDEVKQPTEGSSNDNAGKSSSTPTPSPSVATPTNATKTITTPILNKVASNTNANSAPSGSGTLATPVLRRVVVPSGTTPTTLAQLQAAASNQQRRISSAGGTPNNNLNIGDALATSGTGSISPAMARSVLASAGIPTGLLPAKIDDNSIINLARDIISTRLLADVLLRRGIVPNIGSPSSSAPEDTNNANGTNSNVANSPISSGAPVNDNDKVVSDTNRGTVETKVEPVPAETNSAATAGVTTPIVASVGEPVDVLPSPATVTIPTPASVTATPTVPSNEISGVPTTVASSIPVALPESVPVPAPQISDPPVVTPIIDSAPVPAVPAPVLPVPVSAPSPVPAPVPVATVTSAPTTVSPSPASTPETPATVETSKQVRQTSSPPKEIKPLQPPVSSPKAGPPSKTDIATKHKEAAILPQIDPVSSSLPLIVPVIPSSPKPFPESVPAPASTIPSSSIAPEQQQQQRDSVLSNLKKQSVHTGSASKYIETVAAKSADVSTKSVPKKVSEPVIPSPPPTPAATNPDRNAVPVPTPVPEPVESNKDLFTTPAIVPNEILTASDFLTEAIKNHPATKSSSGYAPSSTSISKHVASMLSPYLVGSEVSTYDEDDDRTAANALLARIAASAPQWQSAEGSILFGTHEFNPSSSTPSGPRSSPHLSNALILASSFALDGERTTKAILDAQMLGNEKLRQDTDMMVNEYQNSLDLREYNFMLTSPQNFAKALGMKPIEQLMMAQHAVNTSLMEMKEGIVTSPGLTNENQSYDPSWVAVGGPTALSDVRNMHRQILTRANAKVRKEVNDLYRDWIHFRTTAREIKRDTTTKRRELDALTAEIQMLQRDIRQARSIADAEKPQLQADIDSLARDVANMEGITLIDAEKDATDTNDPLMDENNHPIQTIHPDEQLTLSQLIAWSKTSYADNEEARSRRLAHAVTSAMQKAMNEVENVYASQMEEIRNLYQLRVISAREDAEAYYQHFMDTEEARVKERIMHAKNSGTMDGSYPWENVTDDDTPPIISPATTLAALRGLATGNTGALHYPTPVSPLRTLSPSSRSPTNGRYALPSNEKEMLRLSDDQEMKAQNIRNEIKRTEEKIEIVRELIEEAEKLKSLKETIRAFWRMSPVGFIPSYYFIADTVNPQSVAAHARATFLHQCVWYAPFSNRFYDKLREIHNELKHRIDTGQYLNYLVSPSKNNGTTIPTVKSPYAIPDTNGSLSSPVQRKSVLKSTASPNNNTPPPPWLKDVPTFPPPSGSIVTLPKVEPISRPLIVGRGANKRNNNNRTNLQSSPPQVYSSGIGHYRPVSQTTLYTQELQEKQNRADEELLESFTQQFLHDTLNNTSINKMGSKDGTEEKVSLHQPPPEPLPAPPSLGASCNDKSKRNANNPSMDQRSTISKDSTTASSRIRPIIQKYSSESSVPVTDKSTVSINQNIEGNKVKQLAAALADYLSSRRVIPDHPISKVQATSSPHPRNGTPTNGSTIAMSSPPLPPPPRTVGRTANGNNYTVRQFKGFSSNSTNIPSAK